jgi:DNA-binding transcriptional LysR family regulator
MGNRSSWWQLQSGVVGIELRHLRAFVVLAEELNFTRAAERLHVVQQALSTQIRQLEDDLGAKLFVRTSRRVVLTAAGQALLAHAPSALAHVDAAIERVRHDGRGEAGALTLGLLATAPLDFTPTLLRAFAEDRPQAEVSIRNVAFDDPSGGVRDGQSDVALVWRPFDETGLSCEPLFTDERTAVLRAGHPLSKHRFVDAVRLADEPFVWVEDMDPVARDFWTLADSRSGRRPRIGATITGFEDLFAAVRAGRAVAACPRSITNALSWPDLVTRPVRGLAPAVVAVCWRTDDARPLVRAFVACARRIAEGLPRHRTTTDR